MRLLPSLAVAAAVALPGAAGALDLHLAFEIRPSFETLQSFSFDSPPLPQPPAPLVGEAGSVDCALLDELATSGCGEVDAGAILLSASVVADKGDEASTYAQAEASYTDQLEFLCGGQTCPEGTATLRAGVTGKFSPALLDPWNSSSSFVLAQAQLEITSFPPFNRSQSIIDCLTNSSPPCFDLVAPGTGTNQPISAMVEIEVSLPAATNRFTVRARARAEADPGFRCIGSYCDRREPTETQDQPVFASLATVQWLGIEVRDSEGTLIRDVTAISPTSGIDWAQPVPEPALASLRLGALAVVLLLARFVRSSRLR